MIISKYQDIKSISKLPKSEWQLIKFEDLLSDNTKHATKIKKEDYYDTGEFPIIDQGKDYVSGYTSSNEGLYENIPSIIFGDHTRALKYVDFPHFLGADGVKLLKNKKSEEEILTKYIYYYLCTVNLPNTGYNRHFKYLKEIVLPIPNISIQRKIVEVLDKSLEIINKRKAQIEELDKLTQSVFLEMFGDPLTNDKEFPFKSLNDIARVGSSKRVFVEELVDEGVPFYRGTEIGSLALGEDISPTLFITEEHYRNLKQSSGIPVVGDLLMPSICPDGRIWRVRDNAPFYFKDGRVLWVHFTFNDINTVYIQYALKDKLIRDYLNIASGTTFAELKIFSLKKVKLMIPPLDLQNKFSSHVDKIQEKMTFLKKNLIDMQNLYNSLQQHAFKGELFTQEKFTNV